MKVALSLTHPRAPGQWASVTESTTEPGRWQLTWWDARGPVGHTTRDTPRECVDEVLRDGMEPCGAEGPDAGEAVRMMVEARAEQACRKTEIEAWLAGDEG